MYDDFSMIPRPVQPQPRYAAPMMMPQMSMIPPPAPAQDGGMQDNLNSFATDLGGALKGRLKKPKPAITPTDSPSMGIGVDRGMIMA